MCVGGVLSDTFAVKIVWPGFSVLRTYIAPENEVNEVQENQQELELNGLTLSLLMSYIYGALCKARNFNVVYIWTNVWQRGKPSLSICCTMLQH
jgi:hypothetical protein